MYTFNSAISLVSNRYKALHGYVNVVKLELSGTRLGNIAISATNVKIYFWMRSQIFSDLNQFLLHVFFMTPALT
jgi:hypothetical protein